MATKKELQDQQKSLEKLVKLKEQLAKLDLSVQSAEAEKLTKKINGVTESLVKMGMTEERVNAFYDAFVRANAAINDVSISLSGNLLKSINTLNTQLSEGVKSFTTPFEEFKIGAENVTDLLQNAIKTSANLETIGLERRRENTRGFAQESIKLTSDLAKAYESLIKNEGNIGTAKFSNLNVEKEIANTLLYINNLDKMKLQLGAGYYSNLRMQAVTVLEMLEDISVINKVNTANHNLAKQTLELEKQRSLEAKELLIAQEKRSKEVDKEYAKYLSDEAKKQQAEADRIDKQIQEQDRLDNALIKRTQIRLMKQRQSELDEEEKKQNELNKLREKQEQDFKRGYDNLIDKMLSKMPGGGILTKLATLGATAQLLSLVVGGIMYLLLRWDFLVSKFTEKLSIARSQAEATLKAAGSLASQFNLVNVYAEQVAIAIAEINEGLGGMDITPGLVSGNNFVERMVQGATVLSDTFGLAGKEIAGMQDASIAMGVSLSSNAIMATTMSKGIMSANKLMQSLANLSPKLLTGFKGSNTQLISMVTKMKLLGVEANNVVSANNKLLDIESSITNAFEAQVATGAQINIDRLMALQMSGKYSDVLDEQLKTLKQSDYLNRSPLAQQLIAEGLGLDAETASQMMLRNVLMERVGLTDELIKKRQQEGKLLEDDIRLAERQGRISKLEADRMMDIAKEYDSKTVQEKFIRALNDFANSLSSTLGPLVNVLRTLTNGIDYFSKSFGGMLYGLGNIGTGITSGIVGIAGVAATIILAKKGINAVKAMSSLLRGGVGVGAASTAANASQATAQAMAGAGAGAATGIGTAGKFMKGLKAGGALGAVAAAAELGLNLAQGQSFGEAAGRAGLSGGLGLAGAALGSLIPVPVVGTLAGGFIGSAIGDFLGNQIYGNQLTPQEAAFLESNIGAYQNASAGSQASTNTTAFELINSINLMSSKLDTANALLSAISNKPTEIAVELDGERVGKAVMSYSSATMDRNRVIGNNYGANRDQYSNRVPR